MSAPIFLNASGLLNPYGGRPCFAIQVGPYQAGELRVVRFRGDERLNQPFLFDVTIATTLAYRDVKKAVCGQPVRLSMESPDSAARRIEGIIASFSALGASTRQDGTHVFHYRVTIVPRLRLLEQRKAHRVFEDKSLLDIALAILADCDIKPDVRLDPTRYLPVRFMMQRGESDLAFVHRLFALAGISYCFEHPLGKPSDFPPRIRLASFTPPPTPPLSAEGLNSNERMVLVDSAAVMTTLDGTHSMDGLPKDGALAYSPGGGHGLARESISAFEATDQIGPCKVTVLEWSIFDHLPTEQTTSFDASIYSAEAALEVVEYQREGSLVPSLETYQQQAIAARSLAQLRSTTSSARGKSDSRRLAPGVRFVLGTSDAPHPIDDLEIPYYVTAVRCEGTNLEELEKNQTADIYTNEFECAPAALDPRPAKPQDRPQLGGEPATVIGAYEGCWEGFPQSDEQGRILVRFHWGTPRDPKKAPPRPGVTGECYVHWLEPWAGEDCGTRTLPRVGSEVWVDFQRHEGASPIAKGQLQSRKNRAPFAPFDAADSFKLGLRSQSRSPMDGTIAGYSEISIDDAPDNEAVRIRAQRDMETEVLADRHTQVWGHSCSEVHGWRIEHTASSRSATVGETDSLTVNGARIVNVHGNHTIATSGSCAARAGTDHEISAGTFLKMHADDRVHLESGGQLRIDTVDDQTVVCGGSYRHVVGSDGAAKSSETTVYGPHEHWTKGLMRFTSETGIELACGSNVLRITPDIVTLNGNVISLNATDSATIGTNNAAISVTKNVDVDAQQVTLASSSASLQLSSTATLAGSSVALSSNATSLSQNSSPNSPDAPTPIPLVFKDPDGNPRQNCKVVAVVDGKKMTGETDGSGSVTVAVPQEVEEITATIWIGPFPKGLHETHTIQVHAAALDTSLLSMRKRLVNLGYADAGSTDPAQIASAVARFQLTAKLNPTGVIDGATKSALQQQAHG